MNNPLIDLLLSNMPPEERARVHREVISQQSEDAGKVSKAIAHVKEAQKSLLEITSLGIGHQELNAAAMHLAILLSVFEHKMASPPAELPKAFR